MWGTTRCHSRSVSWVGVWRERELPTVKSQDKWTWTRPLGGLELCRPDPRLPVILQGPPALGVLAG